jgi:tetratricopeptide (TPR) repeat protein
LVRLEDVMIRVLARVLICLCIAAPAWAQEHQHGAQPAERLGKVHFETSCSAAVRDGFDRAIALLHSFWYAAAIDAFNDVAAKDPSCAMAHWGAAMGIWGNPLGGTRTPQILERGRAAVARAKATPAKTERERGYVAAVDALYTGDVPQPQRAAAYEKAMEAVVTTNPKDTEAKIFYAIGLDAAADPADKTYAKQLKAAGILEPVFKAQPDHPGVAHYLIHSYDVPALAGKGLPAARRYASIAPDAPHALHMPSHIFTRVGAWQDSIDSNRASASSALKANSPPEALHAMDYQAYAYLQLGRDEDAIRILGETKAILAKVEAGSGYGFAGVYGATAIPARVALERGIWKDAAALPTQTSAFPHGDAVILFARALGAARSGQAAEARKNSEALAPLVEKLRASNEVYWAGQVEIQRKASLAWTLNAEGKAAEAIALARQAADDEDATEKSPVSPGPIAPARELLAEMLLESGQAAPALAEFEKAMMREPGRFRALAGAMKAADKAGDRAKTRKYANELLALAKNAAPGRPDLTEARRLAK